MTDKEMEVWLVQWFNRNGAGSCRIGPHMFLSGAGSSDLSLVLMAFDLTKLAADLHDALEPKE